MEYTTLERTTHHHKGRPLAMELAYRTFTTYLMKITVVIPYTTPKYNTYLSL